MPPTPKTPPPLPSSQTTNKIPRPNIKNILKPGAGLKMFSGANKRIDNSDALIMILVALIFFDLPQIVLEWTIVGLAFSWILTVIAATTFLFWFYAKGMSFVKPSRWLTMLVSFGIDIIPGNNLTIILGFVWTINTIILIAISRFEDVFGIKIPLPGAGKVAAPTPK